MPYKKPITNTNRVARNTQRQQEQEQGERHTRFATHRHQAGGAPRDSRLAAVIRSVAYVIWTGGVLLLAGIIAVLMARVLPPGPGGIILIVTVIGLLAVAPTIARRTFVTGLDVIERVLVTPDTASAPRHAYDANTAIALQVIALHDAGQSEAAIEAATGVPRDTIVTILEQRDEFLATATVTRRQSGRDIYEVA